jgi:hypothetical protein
MKERGERKRKKLGESTLKNIYLSHVELRKRNQKGGKVKQSQQIAWKGTGDGSI